MSSRRITAKRASSSTVLTDKQRTFVMEYLADNRMCATTAAKAAGYSTPQSAGGKCLSVPAIQRAIGVEIRKRLSNGEITASRVLRELSHIGFLDPQDMFNEDDSLKQIRSMPENIRRCIAGIEVKQVRVKKIQGDDGEDQLLETSIVKIKLWPKTNALELIAKHLGMLDERFKVEHGVDPASRAVLKSLLERLENAPSPVIDAKYIEHQAGALPNVIDAKVVSDSADDEVGDVPLE